MRCPTAAAAAPPEGGRFALPPRLSGRPATRGPTGQGLAATPLFVYDRPADVSANCRGVRRDFPSPADLSGSPAERAIDGVGEVAVNRRLRVVLGRALHRAGGIGAGQHLDQRQRLVETGGYAAAGQTIAVDYEARMPGDDMDLGKSLQARNKGPMRGGPVTVEQPAWASSSAPSQTEATIRAPRLCLIRKSR